MRKACLFMLSLLVMASCAKDANNIDPNTQQTNNNSNNNSNNNNNNSSGPGTIDGKAVILGTYLGSYSVFYTLSQSPGYANYYYSNCKLELIMVGDTIKSYVINLDSTYPGGVGDKFLNTAALFPDTTTTLEMQLYPGEVVPSGCRSIWITYKPQSDSIYFNGNKVCSPAMATYEFKGIRQ